MTDGDHPDVPVGEWDGRHIDWSDETCRLCGAGLVYVGDERSGHTECEASGETLLMP